MPRDLARSAALHDLLLVSAQALAQELSSSVSCVRHGSLRFLWVPATLTLKAGPHSIQGIMAGYKDSVVTVNVATGGQQEVDVNLSRQRAHVRASIRHVGAIRTNCPMARPNDPGRDLQRLEGVTKRNREQFIESEFSLASTFCDLAETEYKLGNREHADTLVMRASEAADKATEYLSGRDLPEEQGAEMRRQLEQLRRKLDDLQRHVA